MTKLLLKDPLSSLRLQKSMTLSYTFYQLRTNQLAGKTINFGNGIACLCLLNSKQGWENMGDSLIPVIQIMDTGT